MERTLVLIKPDGVRRKLVGRILSRFEEEDLQVIALKMLWLSEQDAGRFYAVHRERPFYSSLCRYMSSGPIVAVALEGREAIGRVRKIMGATDPKKAEPGTIRAEYGESIEANTVHGSDSPESAPWELRFFFSERELLSPEKAPSFSL
jgi:nucleoside-diphosphate kinase